MRLFFCLVALLLCNACDNAQLSCDAGVDALALVVDTNGTVIRSFPVGWGPMAPRVSTVGISQVGGRYVYLNMDRIGRLYDLESGSFVRDVQYEGSVSADPYRLRLLETAIKLGPVTLAGDIPIETSGPFWTRMSAVNPAGESTVLLADSVRIPARYRVAFADFGTTLPLSNGDVLYMRQDYQYLLTLDSLGANVYQTYYSNDWNLAMLDAATGRSIVMARLPGEPHSLSANGGGSIVSFTVGFQSYVVDLESGEVRELPEEVRVSLPSRDGQYLLVSQYDDATFVRNRVTGDTWPVGGGNGRNLGMVIFGPGDSLYVSLVTRNDSVGVWRMPLRPPTGVARAKQVWSAMPAGRRLGLDVRRVDLSAPLFLNEHTFVVLINARDIYDSSCL